MWGHGDRHRGSYGDAGEGKIVAVEPGSRHKRRRVRLAASFLLAPILAVMGFMAGSAPDTLTAPISGYWPVHLTPFLLGPYSTVDNFGYESSSQISPIIPTSYSAWRSPTRLGIQFVGDAPGNLRSDQFSLSVVGPGGKIRGLKVQYSSTGFVGWAIPPLAPGTYHITFFTPLFQRSKSVWTLHLVKPKTPIATSRETASDRISLDTLNAYRALLDESPVTWSNALADAAAAHAQYVKTNGYSAPSFHMEASGRQGYSGVTPWARDLRFGWQSVLDGEVGIESSGLLPPVTVVQDLVDTVFHRLSLLSANLIASGEGSSTGNTGAVVMDLGYGYNPKLPLGIVYPRPGQTGIPISWVDLESPDPVPSGFGHRYGYPITLDFPTAQSVKSLNFGLFLGKHPVPVYKDHPGTNSLSDNQMGMVPKSPLFPNTVYTVSAQGKVLFNSGAVKPLNLHWSFQTGDGSESLAAAPVSPRQVVVSVVRAGSGTPLVDTRVRLYRVGASGRLWLQTMGHTNQHGVWEATRTTTQRALYQVTSSTGNSQQFWWGNS